MWLRETGRPSQYESVQRLVVSGLPWGEGRGSAGELVGEREVEVRACCLGDVTGQHGGVSRGQRAPKGTAASSPTITRLSYQWLADSEGRFTRYAKQAGSAWLKLCFGGYF